MSALPDGTDVVGGHSPFEARAVVVGFVKQLQTSAVDVPHAALPCIRVRLRR